MSATLTAMDAVSRAESDLKKALAAGGTGEKLRKAEDALLAARAAATSEVERARERERLTRELANEKHARAQDERRRQEAERERAVLSHAPVIRFEYEDLRVTIKLRGGHDPHIRAVLLNTAKEVMRILNQEFLERMGPVVAGHRDPFDADRLRRLLEYEVGSERKRFGCVEITQEGGSGMTGAGRNTIRVRQSRETEPRARLGTPFSAAPASAREPA